ncbi:innexin unc-9 [Octopus bimaculoides]|uniref:Innexin n=1 Tax=Octopus bimaculoides TaxID=37653 RepID=A0A0L8HQL9_OCTBM|nr:innexin unc-9 [Octopus bimaculoides]|eukprot:XP_014770299.1 PREDICTED: innexin unc-9-like [Octopus bimaculoides]
MADTLEQLDGFSSIIAAFLAKKLVSQTEINEDLCSAISHTWTVFLLIIFAVIVTFTYLIGEPIHCLAPPNWPKQEVNYAKSYCWVSNTYYIGMKYPIPTDPTSRTEEEVTYYQWAPIIFLFMATLFKTPDMVWRFVNSMSGIRLKKIIALAQSSLLESPEKYKMNIRNIACFIDMWLEGCWKRKLHRVVTIKGRNLNVSWLPFSKKEGTYFISFYIFVKFLFTVNVIGQFFLLNAFLSDNFTPYDIFRTIPSKGSARFPRVTLCDLELRQLQNIHLYTLQCVLPVNLFNEKIFIFLWFWLIFVAVVTCANVVLWIYRAIFSKRQSKYVLHHLSPSKNILIKADGKKMFKHFTTDYLRNDGFFILRMIAKNTTNLVLEDLLKELWHLYNKRIDQNFQQPGNCNTFNDILRENLPAPHILKSLIYKRNIRSP